MAAPQVSRHTTHAIVKRYSSLFRIHLLWDRAHCDGKLASRGSNEEQILGSCAPVYTGERGCARAFYASETFHPVATRKSADNSRFPLWRARKVAIIRPVSKLRVASLYSVPRSALLRLSKNHKHTALAVIPKSSSQCRFNNVPSSTTICGPNQSTSKDNTPNRTNRPRKIATRKSRNRISNTAAPSTKILNGIGGGSIPGNISAQNSCASKD